MSDHEIAIIGMAARFPGAASIAEYWANLRDGVSSIVTLSESELRAAGVTPEELADPGYVRRCPVLDGVDDFDAAFFGINPRDASVMDPAHRMFLEVAWEALEHAGRTGVPAEGAVGVFATSGAPYYLMDHVRRSPELMKSMGEFLVRHTNNDMNFLATRVSYELDLRGPSINIQTACSSALVSVHLACESIRRGECAMALAGGATVNIPHRHGYHYREGEILSPDGICRPFDARSAGTVFGSGVGCVVLKRLSAALDDGDTIHAVIKGSAVNNDGAGRVGFLAPGVDGQAAAVRRALEVSGVDAGSISYIEAHGTGTSVGDPIEVEALTQAFAPSVPHQRCALGSVKSNIGHLGEAAGIASLIKAVLALEHRELPPSLGYETANPNIAFASSPFFVNDVLRPWQWDGPLRCGITALGAGGTNCHMIVEEAPARLAGEGARAAQLLVLSAQTPAALTAAREALASALRADASMDLADAAYTLAEGRRAMPFRHVVVAASATDAIARLEHRHAQRGAPARADDQRPQTIFMFPGGGAQYAGMGRDLFKTEPVYRNAVGACLAIVNARLGRDLAELLFAPDARSAAASRELERPSLSLPALFTTEYALATLFAAWGLEANAYLGHSMGEYVAACLAGVISLEEALELVMLRGRLFETLPAGRMLSVPMSEQALRSIMTPGLDIAAVNAAELCVASGPVAAVERLEQALESRGLEFTRVRIDVAAHSFMLEPVLSEFHAFCRTVAWQKPRRPFLSNVSGRWITDAEATDPEYWVRHLRSTVRFADCLETLRASGNPVLVEIGPGCTLASLARAQRAPVRHAFNSMRHPDERSGDLENALATLGNVWTAGGSVDWSALYDGQLRNRIALPTYPWDHQRHWIDAPRAPALATRAPTPAAGRRDRVEEWFARPAWHQTMPVAPLEPSTDHVLVFRDTVGLGDAVASRLAAAGCRVTLVSAGTEWSGDASVITVRPAERTDYERLLKHLAMRAALPRHIVHCWGVTHAGVEASVDAMRDIGFSSLVCLAQALSSEDVTTPITLDVVTSGLQQVGNDVPGQPAKALLLGPLRVMPRELPNVTARSIDVILPDTTIQRSTLAALVASEVTSPSADETVAIRGRERFVQASEPVSLPRISQRLRSRGVYLITGGFGGIGLTLARHLVIAHHARLVLIGRGTDTARARAALAELQAFGSEVEVVRADVTNAAQVSNAIRRAHMRFGEINGVFHTAGVLDDGLMALKSREQAERVLAPKVQGTLVLDAALGDTPLDLFVLFSSISAFAGLPGQADYSAANAFLDAFAGERAARTGSFTVAIDWSAWQEVGMVANLIDAGGESGHAVHPVLGRRIWGAPDGALFASELQPAMHWVLGEHRLRGGSALMPGTGHLELARAALFVATESRPLLLRDVAFLSALVARDDAPCEMRIRVAGPQSMSRTFVIASRTEGNDEHQPWEEHVTGTGGYVDDAPPPPLDIALIAARCRGGPRVGDGTHPSVNMAFGPRWTNLQSVQYGEGEALLTLELPLEFAADLERFPLHPALMDMATGGVVPMIAGFNASRDFYVPLSYARLRIFAPLTPRIRSHVRLVPSDLDTDGIVVFDVTITDEAGRVLVDADEFMMTRVTDTSLLQGGARRRPSHREPVSFDPPALAGAPSALMQRQHDAIRPDEGMRALECILAGPDVTQLSVTPQPLADLIEQLRRPAERAQASTVLPPVTATRFLETERHLGTHPSVEQAVVIERFDRPGKRHLVGYVVPSAETHPTASELRRFAKKALAGDLVPGVILLVENLPVDGSGAIDIAQLHDPFGLTDDYIAPRSEMEQAIAAVWRDALGVERVGVHDNFFDIGGHSLLAVRAVVRIDRAVGVRLNQSIMVMQTLEQIAAEVDRQRSAPPSGPSAGAPPADAAHTEKSSGGFLRSLRNVASRNRA